jgi:type II secretory pathway pseudopilin PulG
MARVCRALRGDDGVSLVESMIAVTMLALAIVLTMQPVLAAMGWLDESRAISTAENLAQAEIEAIRALEYEDVGIEGYTPAGVLQAERVEVIGNREYTIKTEVEYAGSLTGLDVIDQGGDGVQGAWDPGVDYKVVRVSVDAGGRAEPVIMETIVAPPNIGAHEGIANARVFLAPHEPFAASGYTLPELQIHQDPYAPVRSGSTGDTQVFPGVPPGDYTVEMAVDDGWLFHPDDVLEQITEIEVVEGQIAETTLRVYRPARLIVSVTDSDTGEAIPDARVTLIHEPTRVQTDYAPGEYTIEGILPDAYDIRVSAADYIDFELISVNVPENYPVPDHYLDVNLEPVPPPTTTTSTTTTSTTTTTVPGSTTTVPGSTTTTTTTSTTTTTIPTGGEVDVTFYVIDNTGRPVHGADVKVPHPTYGLLTVVTGPAGTGTLELEAGGYFTATASTDWGHGSVSQGFTASQGLTVTLQLTRPSGRGTLVMQNADDSDLYYRRWGDSRWTRLLVNVDGEASFVAGSGWYEVARVCTRNGRVVDWRSTYVQADENRLISMGGWCPS